MLGIACNGEWVPADLTPILSADILVLVGVLIMGNGCLQSVSSHVIILWICFLTQVTLVGVAYYGAWMSAECILSRDNIVDLFSHAGYLGGGCLLWGVDVYRAYSLT